MNETKLSFDEAKLYCGADGSKLASPVTPAAAAKIHQYLKEVSERRWFLWRTLVLGAANGGACSSSPPVQLSSDVIADPHACLVPLTWCAFAHSQEILPSSTENWWADLRSPSQRSPVL